MDSELLEWFEEESKISFGELMYSCVSKIWYASMNDPMNIDHEDNPDKFGFITVRGKTIEEALSRLRTYHKERELQQTYSEQAVAV